MINCAAWTNVDGAEAEEDAATAINGRGAGHVAAAAQAAGAWTSTSPATTCSTGAKRTPYVESDRVGPLSAYGRSKLAGERRWPRAAPDSHTVVRSAWLFGVGGECFPKTIRRLAGERDELTIVDDQVGSPDVHRPPRAGARPARRRTAARGSCTWPPATSAPGMQFAEAIVAASGLDCDVHPITTAEYPVPATRPAYSVLRSERGAPRLPSWREGLAAFQSTDRRRRAA